jgi:hypothetical protein
MRLIFAGKELSKEKDTFTMEDIGVTSNSTIFIVYRLRG